NKVILSAVVLAFALIATIGSTYAWFTVSNTVNVEAMTLNVQSSDSILIRVDNPAVVEDNLTDLSTYKTTLTNADITSIYNFVNWKLQPVTAIQDGYTTVDPSVLNTMAVGDTNYTRDLVATVDGTDKNQTTGKYIELTFWLYSTSATAQDIILQDLSVSSNVANSSTQAAVVNAVRFGVWASGQTPLIYGLDNDYDFAFTNGLPGYWDTAVVDAVPGTDEFNALTELDGGHPFLDANNVFYASNATTWAASITAGAADASKLNADVIYTLPSETPTLFTVRIYVEGWDEQTTNDIIAAAFSISFKFALQDA
ncbi:MAG: hypothetical protein PHP32_05660, partial [Candidatus Izemoplasmatales bacterium]|nr:hypothetical protein [Candidatus Izemoplasmatales bacterium]